MQSKASGGEAELMPATDGHANAMGLVEASLLLAGLVVVLACAAAVLSYVVKAL